MSSQFQYLNELIGFAKTELPQLRYDASNAHTPLISAGILERTIGVLEYLTRQVIIDCLARQGADPFPPSPVQHAQVARAHVPAPASAPRLVPRVPAPAPAYEVPAGYMLVRAPAPAPAGPDSFLPPLGAPVEEARAGTGSQSVAEVTVTPQGTRVVVPGAPLQVVPPGAVASTVPPGMIAYQPPGPGPVGIPGGDPVDVYPRAAVLSPEAAAALQAAQASGAQRPLIDASGARNITDEPAPA